MSPDAIARLRTERPALETDAGDAPDSAATDSETEIRLTAATPSPTPTADALAPVNATCPVSGSAVDPRYRVVYKTKVVGFCCPKCPSQFWAEPEKFASKLP